MTEGGSATFTDEHVRLVTKEKTWQASYKDGLATISYSPSHDKNLVGSRRKDGLMLVDGAHTGLPKGRSIAHMHRCERCDASFAHMHKIIPSAGYFMELCDFCTIARGYGSARVSPAEAAHDRDMGSPPLTHDRLNEEAVPKNEDDEKEAHQDLSSKGSVKDNNANGSSFNKNDRQFINVCKVNSNGTIPILKSSDGKQIPPCIVAKFVKDNLPDHPGGDVGFGLTPLADGTKPDEMDNLRNKLIPRVIVNDHETKELVEKLLDCFKDGYRYSEGNIFQKFAINTFLSQSRTKGGQTLKKVLSSICGPFFEYTLFIKRQASTKTATPLVS